MTLRYIWRKSSLKDDNLDTQLLSMLQDQLVGTTTCHKSLMISFKLMPLNELIPFNSFVLSSRPTVPTFFVGLNAHYTQRDKHVHTPIQNQHYLVTYSLDKP